MKIWCFYLMCDDEIWKFPNIDKTEVRQTYDKLYTLYAYTPTKACAKYFRRTRSRSKFYEKIINIPREDYEDFCKEHDKQLLEFHSMITKSIENGRYTEELVNVLCTTSESDCILYYKEDHLTDILVKGLTSINTSYKILHSNIFTSEVDHIVNGKYMMDDILSIIYPLDADSGASVRFTEPIDEVLLFCYLFADTFSKNVDSIIIDELGPFFHAPNKTDMQQSYWKGFSS